MKSYVVLFLVSLFAFGSALVAGDLKNEDSAAVKAKLDYGHDIVIEVNMKPGYTYRYVCAHCTITVGDTSVEVSDYDNAVIRGGKVVLADE